MKEFALNIIPVVIREPNPGDGFLSGAPRLNATPWTAPVSYTVCFRWVNILCDCQPVDLKGVGIAAYAVG